MGCTEGEGGGLEAWSFSVIFLGLSNILVAPHALPRGSPEMHLETDLFKTAASTFPLRFHRLSVNEEPSTTKPWRGTPRMSLLRAEPSLPGRELLLPSLLSQGGGRALTWGSVYEPLKSEPHGGRLTGFATSPLLHLGMFPLILAVLNRDSSTRDYNPD